MVLVQVVYAYIVTTGVGMPQFSCVVECSIAAHCCGGYIISDGGITCPRC